MFKPNVKELVEKRDFEGLIKALYRRDPNIRGEAACCRCECSEEWFDRETVEGGIREV